MSFDAIVASARPQIALALVDRIRLLDSLLKASGPSRGRRAALVQKNAAVARVLVLGMGQVAPGLTKSRLVSSVPTVDNNARVFRVPLGALSLEAQDIARRAVSGELASCS